MQKNTKKHHRGRRKNHIAGKWIAVLELLIAAIFYGLLWNLGIIPVKYMIVTGIGIITLFGICFVLQFGNRTLSIVGMVLSIVFYGLFIGGSYYIRQMDTTIGKVGGATYKTDNMVVVVRKDDVAASLLDAKGYRFGYQTTVDQENTDLMVDRVKKTLDLKEMTTYENVEELAQALLDNEIDAAIYNEAFNGMIGDSIEGYESKVRILYQYGIDTELVIEEQEETERDVFNIYISGIDVYGPITTNSRSDVNIIMTVNTKTKQILLTTTPRDYYLPIPGISNGQKDKLTHAGIYGVDKSMATLEALYGIDLNYYARVNFTSLIKIIDVLGGVDVYSEYAFTSMHGKYQFQEGMNHMNGEQALGFSRERYSFSAGDNQRGKNQEAVIKAILEKAMSPAILKNANLMLGSVSGSVETNMTKDEMTELVRMQLEDGASWNIVSVNAVGTGDKQSTYSGGNVLRYVMHPDMDSVSEIKTKMNQVMNGEIIQ